MPSSMLFAVNNEGRVFGLSTNGTKWREFPYLGLDFKSISAIQNFLWAVGGDRQIYVHVHGLDIPIRIKEESFENQRWLPIEGFSSRLLPTDRHNFSTEDGLQERPLEKIRNPSMAWQWEGDWKIETVMNGEPLDHDGWTYAIDFPSTYHSTKHWTSCVRRRKWVRTRRYIAMNSWCAVAPLHKDPTREPFIDVSIGGQLMAEERQGALQVWAVTAHGRVMWRKDVSLTCPEGTKWQAVSLPPGCEVCCISCGATGLVWGVLWSGKAVVRTKITPNTPMGEEWVQVESPLDSTTKLVQVSVGHNSVWGVTSDKRVWFRKGVKSDPNSSTDLAKGSGWVEMVGNMNMVSVAPNDQVFAVGTDDRSLYFRVGVTPAELTGKRWRCLNASVCMSRASSVASSCSNLPMSHRSTLSLQNSKGGVEQCEWAEASRSAPTSLKIVPDWQKGTQPSSLPASEGSIEEPSLIHMANGSVPNTERPSRKLTAWSPIRSVGSLIGQEANPFTDPEAEFDEIVHPEREVPSDFDPGWYQADTLWSGVEAGALDLNPAQMPKWFLDADFSDGLEKASWRNKMLSDLRNINLNVSKQFENYEVAVQLTSCVKTVECRCALFGSSGNAFDECLLELEWVGNKCSTVDTASLSAFNLDKSHMRLQLSMAEIVCIASSSEPGTPKISIYTRESATKNESPLRLQFVCDNDHDEWMAYLTYVHAAIGDLQGPPGVSSIWALTHLGDVYAFSSESLQRQQYSGGLFSTDVNCMNHVIDKDWTHQLNNGFPPDSCVTVAGFIPKNVDRFSVNLDVNTCKNVAFHINPRFDENCIIRNSKENGEWMKEEKEGLLTLTQGGDFEIKILCLKEGFKVSINGIVFTYFEHRLSPHGITHVRVVGGIELQKVTYDSKEVILPLDKMVWKQVGGHMKVVETCSAGVTWGITSNNVPYCYTGGWGGLFLNGLQKSEAGIHGMVDHCVLDVWENQRWNPLSGFSSRGLPTDRPMWSDITGLHKRSKDTTRLLSKHWQWINDWTIDFQAPGGVDNDGWQYAIDFSTTYHPNKGIADIVRRRRWIRTCKLTTSGPWAEVGNSKVLDISLQDSTGLDAICVWAVSAKGDALYRKGVTKSNPIGELWEHVACSELLETISCGCSNQVWASSKTGSSYWRFGISTSNPKGDLWELVEPPKGALIKKVSVARWAVWALDQAGKIYVRREVTPVFPEGTHWQSISTPDFDNFKDISASGDEVWAITSSGTLVRRLGVSCENPAGYSWSNGLSANWRYVSARSYTSKTMPQRR